MKNTVNNNENGITAEKPTFRNWWLKDWCREHQISMKKPSKRFYINTEDQKKRNLDLLKKIRTAWYTFMKIYGVDSEIVMPNKMQLHRNKLSQEKTLSFKRAVQTTFAKENHTLFQERVTVMTSAASGKSSPALNLEFVFNGVGKRVRFKSTICCYTSMGA